MIHQKVDVKWVLGIAKTLRSHRFSPRNPCFSNKALSGPADADLSGV